MIAIVILLALLLASVAYEAVGEWRDRHRYRPPGTLLAIERGRVHVLEQGSGEPAVLLEAGIAGTLLGWARVQPSIAQFTRVLSYDRAGLGWSDRIGSARTLDNVLGELAGVHRGCAIGKPVLLVGHSFGALLALAYAHRYPDAVAGLVLVDPAGVDTWAHGSASDRKRLAFGVALSRRGALLARLGIVRMTLDLLASGGRRLPALVGKSAAGRGASTISRLIDEVQLLPPECAPLVRAHWSNPKSFTAMAQYLESLPAVAAAVETMPVMPQIPITVLSAETATESELRERERWVAASSRGVHVRVPDSGHWIQIRRPDAVIDAVRDMVELVRVSIE